MNTFSRGAAATAALILTLSGCGGAFAPQDNAVALKAGDAKTTAELNASCTFYSNVLTLVDKAHFNGPLSVSQQEVAAGAVQGMLKGAYQKVGYDPVTDKWDESIITFTNPAEKATETREISSLTVGGKTFTYAPPSGKMNSYSDQCAYIGATAQELGKATGKSIRAMFDDALNGALHASRDPHTGWSGPEQYKDLLTQTKGEFGGVGFEVMTKQGLLEIRKIIPDAPAEKAGLQPGDRITKIDGNSALGKTREEAIALVRGPVDSNVILTIQRAEKEFDVTLKRATITPPAVEGKLVGEKKDTAHIKIKAFSDKTLLSLVDTIRGLWKETQDKKIDVKTVIVDVRNNLGGLLPAAAAVADMFVEGAKPGEASIGSQIPLFAVGKTAQDQIAYAEEVITANISDAFPNAKVKVLQNGFSASASEITAGALQDVGHEVLGTRSFGKGSVQTILPFDLSGNPAEEYKTVYGGLRLTTAAFFPGKSGLSNQGSGIIPNTEVKYGDVRDKVAAESRREEQLGRALISTEQTRAGQTPQNVCSLKAEFSGELSAQQVKSLPDYLVTDYMLVPDEEEADFKEIKVFDADLACALKDVKYTTTKPFMPN